MVQTRAVVRRWGSSLAAIIPTEALQAEGITEGDDIVMDVRRGRPPRELFGLLAKGRLKAQPVKDAIRREDNE